MLKELRVKLTVSVIKQGKRYIAFSPALDLSTSGKSEAEAKRRFQEAVSIFFEELNKAGNVAAVLSGLGWRKEQRKWQPPHVVAQESVGVRIPAAA